MVTKEQRRRRLARQHWERQQVRRATSRRRARRNGIIVAVVVGILAVAAVIYLVFFLLRGDSPSAAARPGISGGTSAGIGVLAAPPAAPGPGYILGNGADRPRHGEYRAGTGRLVPVVAENPVPRDSSLATVTRPRSIAGVAGTGQAASSTIGKDVKVTTT